MTVYCNVSKCVYRMPIDKSVQQEFGRGYVPVGGLGVYKGRCGLGSVSIYPRTVRSSTGLRKVLSICSNFSETEKVEVTEADGLNCSQKACRYNREGSVCERTTFPDMNLFFDSEQVYDGIERNVLPVCKSYSTAHRSGLIDWSRAYNV